MRVLERPGNARSEMEEFDRIETVGQARSRQPEVEFDVEECVEECDVDYVVNCVDECVNTGAECERECERD